ncbi:MAG: hypothetical protein GDA48_26700 [Hormoscilla sp. GM102CHS1]|nr:hypothetical protein [Hormoscilla sp. GM102CHS1]
MTADEALALVETLLDYQPLNGIQETIFRKCWEDRHITYEQIAKSTGYQPDYLKQTGYKLWDLLTDAFGEKVKKKNLQSVLKRYLRRNQLTLHRNQVIGVNLNCATLHEANLSARFAVGESDLYQSNSQGATIPNDNTRSGAESSSDEEENHQEVQFHSEERVYDWNGLQLRTDAEVKIAQALDRASVIFSPNPQLRLTTPEGRLNQQPNFAIFHQGKLGILLIDPVPQHPDVGKTSQSIQIVQHYHPNRCREEPDRVVQEFLAILTEA